MEGFDAPRSLSNHELAERLDAWEVEERELSSARWVLLDRIDVIRAERVRRLKLRYTANSDEQPTAPRLLRGGAGGVTVFSGEGEVPPLPLQPLGDLEALTDDALEEHLRRSKAAEDDVSLRRRVLHQYIDWVKAEIARRQGG